MNVLIIDDQPDVVEGIRLGIDWNFLAVSHIFHAYNSEAAKSVIEQEEIDIALCDIEMPNGSGLELFEWACEAYPDIKFIFLTSHADFAYAQQALKLGGFDYLVQPAPYALIQDTLQKALLQLQKEKEQQQVLVYGNYVSKHEKELLNVFLREYLSGRQRTIQTVIQYLKTLSIDIEPEEKSWMVCIQILAPDKLPERFGQELLCFVVENVFMEMMGDYSRHLLFCALNVETYAGVFYTASTWDQEDICKQLDQFVLLAKDKLHLSVACYVGWETRLTELPDCLRQILELAESNIVRKAGVFRMGLEDIAVETVYDAPNFEQMKHYFLLGQYQMVSDMVQEYFRKQERKGRISNKILAYFQQDFLQMFFELLSARSVKAHEAFQQAYDVMALKKSTESLSQMFHLVDFVISYLKGLEEENDRETAPVEKAVAYIRKNIHQNISRMDIADYIYMNPDYLSRLFKKEKNISLTDYIVQEKLKMASAMLRSTNLPVSVIASNIGYTNFSYFTQVFRKSYGMSPSEYRQNSQK
ncbi:MAG: response regulator [Lachnospiraceae bacterium]|nr:response regulator [Lachnospiraceae bacterium]MDE7001839.1 response regulator [Lachnospiraceae bacterium]